MTTTVFAFNSREQPYDVQETYALGLHIPDGAIYDNRSSSSDRPRPERNGKVRELLAMLYYIDEEDVDATILLPLVDFVRDNSAELISALKAEIDCPDCLASIEEEDVPKSCII